MTAQYLYPYMHLSRFEPQSDLLFIRLLCLTVLSPLVGLCQIGHSLWKSREHLGACNQQLRKGHQGALRSEMMFGR